MQQPVSRRTLLKTLGAAAGAAIVSAGQSSGQTAQPPQGPPTTISNPPRDFGPNAPPTTYFSDPDILTIDPRFNDYVQPNSAIKRLWTGALWAEGPAWSAQGRYLVFSQPSNSTDGYTFAFQGRQLS